MLKYTLIRVSWIFVVFFTILTMNFVILKFAPEYPPTTESAKEIYYARQVMDGYMYIEIVDDPVVVQQIQDGEITYPARCWVRYLTNQDEYRIYWPVPIAVQYFRWLGNIISDWNWGYSTRVSVNVPVFELLASRIPVTIKLNIIALFFYIPFGFSFGILAALKKNKLIDNIISFGVMIFISVPSFVIMTFLVVILGYKLDWLPAQFPAADVTGAVQLTGLILPVFGLSFGAIAGLTRFTRAELTEVLTSEFLLLARTKGLTRAQAVVRHAMRNSMVPLVPGIIGSFVGLLSGSVIIERIYGIPGTGTIYIQALTQNSYDYNLILAVTAFYTTISLFAVLLVDLSYGIVDPRIRMGARK